MDEFCPPLKWYLYQGAKVLDVGCGPGSLTVDVAREVDPGSVVGVDFQEEAIDQATRLVGKLQLDNVTFQVGDAYSLDFADETFDVTYSHNVLVWLRDPVRALQEQKRVTKPGGWVIARLGTYQDAVIYPPCPALERIWVAFNHLNNPSVQEVFYNNKAAREAVALLSLAGFEEFRIEGFVAPYLCAYPGSGYLEDHYIGLRTSFVHDSEGPWAAYSNKLLDLGVVDEETVQAVPGEIEAWHNHPHALYAEPAFLAAGRVT